MVDKKVMNFQFSVFPKSKYISPQKNISIMYFK